MGSGPALTGTASPQTKELTMTRKDCVAIALAISDGALINCITNADVAMNVITRAKIARQLAETMSRDNPRFDRARFLKACGIAA